MPLEEPDHVVMAEEHLRFRVELVEPLVEDHDRYEVYELDRGLLLGVDLRTLDGHQLVRDVLHDLQGHLDFQHVLNHVVVVSSDQLKDVLPR